MSDQTNFQKQERLIVIGRRFGSDAVAVEATEAAARWARDEAALAPYGFGADMRARFETDRQSHDTLRVSRSVAVAQKKTSYAVRDEHISRGWAWVDQVTSTLGALALTDGELGNQVAAAKPEDDAGLEAGILALAEILAGQKDKLPAENQAEQRLAEAKDVALAVATSPGIVHTSKGQTMADTAEIDLLDGKLYVWMLELNKAGRRAIRNGHLKAARQEYLLHHLKRSGAAPATGPAAPAQNPTPPTPQALTATE